MGGRTVAPAGGRDELKIYVEMPGDLDAAEWRERHELGLVPDAAPYGLHRLADGSTSVAFRHPLAWGRGRRLLHLARGRLEGLDVVTALTDLRSQLRSTADVRLAMDERSGIPAALLPGPPVVTGVAWLEDPRSFPRWYVALARQALRRSVAVFTQCRPMVEPITQAFGVPAERVHAIRLGIDTQHFSPAPWPHTNPTVFSVGDDRMRDYDTLIAAAATAHHHTGLTLELATTLPVELPPGLGVIHRRRMDEAVRECYARASVVAIALKPTRQGSGLTVILEAMASSRPLVVTANPGLEEYVEHGVTGLLVPPGDVRAMAEALRTLAEDPLRAEAMGRAARARVETRFTSGHMADDLRRVIYTALERPAARAGGADTATD